MSLYLVRLELDTPKLLGLGRTRHVPPHAVDVGYLLHCFFSAVFGRDAPRPFVYGELANRRTDRCGFGRTLSVLAYSQWDAESLLRSARSYADPSEYDVVDWNRLAAKRMPKRWCAGQRLGFAARLCPIVRRSKDGKEMDAFLARTLNLKDKSTRLDREQVYRQWLHDEISRRGGVRLLSVGIVRWQLAKLIRRFQEVDNGDRRSRLVERPDVVMRGELEVQDPDLFSSTLERGLGRHRAFGYGMVLLQRIRA